MSIVYEELKNKYKNILKDAPIVVIDSGLGGLKICSKMANNHPCENFIFFADTEFMPFGNKDVKLLTRRIVKIVAKIKLLQPKAVILACNTLDAIAGDKIESQLGNIELIRIISPTAKKAVEISKSKSIGLLATENTINSQKYMYSMVGYYANTNLYGLECPELASTIESNGDIKTTCKLEISPLNDYIFDTLILGCTHYSAVIPIIKKAFPQVEIIDSSTVLIEYFNQLLKEKLEFNVANKGSFIIITTLDNEDLRLNLQKNLIDKDYEVMVEEI